MTSAVPPREVTVSGKERLLQQIWRPTDRLADIVMVCCIAEGSSIVQESRGVVDDDAGALARA